MMMMDRKQPTVKPLSFIIPPFLLLASNTIAARANIRKQRDPISPQCLEDISKGSLRVSDLSDNLTDTDYCSPRRSEIEVDESGTTSEIELSTCDATGSDDAARIIDQCSAAGGEHITVVYSQTCTLTGATNNRKEIIGPLCIPKSCDGDDYVDYVNKRDEGKVALDFGDLGSCRRTIISMSGEF